METREALLHTVKAILGVADAFAGGHRAEIQGANE
jgi:hypothetical protein